MRLYKFIRATYSHPLFFISTYVSFVPVSDVLAIFVSDRRCEFSSKFWFVIRKKRVLVDKFWEDPWSTETKHVLVNPKGFTKSCFIAAFLQCRWGCLYSITYYNINICPTLSKIIQLKMSSMFPPAASSSLPLPSSMRAPPVIPSLGDCFPCGSIDLGKYILYSSALRQRARWRTSLALLFGGHGTLPFADNSVNTVNADVREPKSRTQRFVYV
jgi:hypothetical protein